MKALAEHNSILRQVAEDDKCHLYDLARQMPSDREQMPDGIHLNEESSKVKADLIFAWLVENEVILNELL